MIPRGSQLRSNNFVYNNVVSSTSPLGANEYQQHTAVYAKMTHTGSSKLHAILLIRDPLLCTIQRCELRPGQSTGLFGYMHPNAGTEWAICG